MAKPIVIVHFQPLELYPPVMNLILFLISSKIENLIVYTTQHNKKLLTPFKTDDNAVSINRYGILGTEMPKYFRYWSYIKFYSFVFSQLIKLKPNTILYYETLSCLPVYLYKKFIKQSVRIFAHYHEYTSPDEYISGMKMVKYFHNIEKSIYSKYIWISHTNEDRMRCFLKDEPTVNKGICHILPNYPSKDWLSRRADKRDNFKKIVYVGAVSRDTMYFENFINWVIKMEGKFTFDIYTYNICSIDKKWILDLAVDFIKIHEGVDYFSLPSVLKEFDIGVILYKGHIPNYVMNAPNKLFEYLISGLDVWLPHEMIICIQYYTIGTFPKVIPVDFNSLDIFEWPKAINKENLYFKPSGWYYEDIYPDLAQTLLSVKN